jgi:opacity protein-like surface antigen
MRLFCLLVLSVPALFSQPFSGGFKGGLPLTDFINAVNTQNFKASATTNRYIVGVTGELRLPFGLGVEVDALYRHFGYGSTSIISGITTTSTITDTSGGAWEFPILAKYRFRGTIAHPFVSAGVAWDKLSGLSQTITRAVADVVNTTTSSNPFELNKDTTRGFVLGAGIDVKALLIHIAPEVRFTRWGSKHFIDPNGLFDSKQNQAEFLVGITF